MGWERKTKWVPKSIRPHRWNVSKQLPGEPKVTLKFGKHCGLTLEEIAALPDGLSYLEWIAHRAVPDKRGVTAQLQQLARRVYYQHCAQGRRPATPTST